MRMYSYSLFVISMNNILPQSHTKDFTKDTQSLIAKFVIPFVAFCACALKCFSTQVCKPL